jgi:outer membrane protein insertion porin family
MHGKTVANAAAAVNPLPNPLGRGGRAEFGDAQRVKKVQAKKRGFLWAYGVLAAFHLVALLPLAHGDLPEKVQEKVQEESQLENKIITEIQIDGLGRISQDAVVSKLSTQVGSRMDLKKIRQDILSLNETHYFQKIRFDAKPDPSDRSRIILVIKLKELPVVQEIQYQGNDEFESSQFKDVVKVKVFDILDEVKASADSAAIQKFYEDKGFTLAKVTYELDELPENQIRLRFKIKEFDKLTIKKISFINNKAFSDDQLKRIFGETKEGGSFSFLTSEGNFKEAAFKQDLQRLKLWYWDHGFVQFRHDEPVVTMSDDKRFMYISIYVDEGEIYQMGTVGFEGDLLFPTSELEKELTLKSDQTFRISQQQADIQKLQEKYQDLGYAYVNVIPKTSLRPEARQMDVMYEFEKGELVYFGEFRILGNDKTLDSVIRRELKIREGELYHGTNFRVSKENVERLGFFAPGEVVFTTLTPPERSDILDVEITVKERPTGTMNFGMGIGSLQGFFLQTQISEQNLFGRGQNLSLSAQYSLSVLNRGLNFGFFDPYILDTRFSGGLDVYYTSFSIPGRYANQRTGFDVKLGHPIFEYANILGTYRLESDRVLPGTTTQSVPQWFIDADTGILSSLQGQFIRDKRNNRMEPTAGNYQMASFECAGLGGDMKFFKWVINNRFYSRIIGDLVFRNNTQVGQISGFDHRAVPPSHKFYLGGSGDMKGFQFLQLGPKVEGPDGSVQPLGGNFMGYSLLELEYPLLRELGLKALLFFDLGNNWERLPSVANKDRLEIRMDYGFGFRMFLPMGQLQFTWGWPVDRRANEAEGPVFQLFFGPPF